MDRFYQFLAPKFIMSKIICSLDENHYIGYIESRGLSGTRSYTFDIKLKYAQYNIMKFFKDN